ncbi:MAG: phosphatidate cytidylyltransferase [Alphaproteobacteria bacterium]|nr:phosphatidate cytidylyltransferase [Alphaproteobacteria bacterium]
MIGALLTVAALFIMGGALILLASLVPAGRGPARQLWPVYRSEFLVVGAFLLPVAIGGWAFLAMLLLMAGRGQWETFALFGQSIRAPIPVLAMAGGLAVVVVSALALDRLPVTLAGAVIILLMLGRLRAASTWIAVASLVVPILPLTLMAVLRSEPQGFLWLALAQATVETNDAFALLVGKLIGHKRPFPRLSPGKTWAGLVGGLIAGLTAGLAVSCFLIGLPIFAAMVAVSVALAAGLAGDLAVSAIKRWVGAKDFPSLLPLHGGLLDIYDSLLFAAPALLLSRNLMGL